MASKLNSAPQPDPLPHLLTETLDDYCRTLCAPKGLIIFTIPNALMLKNHWRPWSDWVGPTLFVTDFGPMGTAGFLEADAADCFSITFLFDFCYFCPLGNCRLETFARHFSLGNFPSVTCVSRYFAWELSLGDFRLGSSTLELLLGSFGLETLEWNLKLGALRSVWSGEPVTGNWGNRLAHIPSPGH